MKKSKKVRKLVFDIETNGLNVNDSVLSFSGLLLDENDEIIETYDRYYYPKEKFNSDAIKINGLKKRVITKKRKEAKKQGVTYPEHFSDDLFISEIFNKVDMIIGHNVFFDFQRVSMHHDVKPFKNKKYDTMRKMMYVYDAPYLVYGRPKYPTLKESIEHFGINTKKLKKQLKVSFHSSLFDSYVTYYVYKNLKQLNIKNYKKYYQDKLVAKQLEEQRRIEKRKKMKRYMYLTIIFACLWLVYSQ